MALIASVVIPTRNRRATLAALLERVAPQAKAAAAEVVVVDNGSTDDTPELLRPLEAQGQLRVVREPTPGATRARNAGARAARGDVLAFVDDDALPADGWLAALLVPFANPRVAAAGGRVSLRFAGALPGWWDATLATYLAAYDLGPEPADLGARPWYDSPRGLNLAVRRDALLAVGGFNLRLGPRAGRPSVGEESDLCFRLLARGHEIRYVPGAVVGVDDGSTDRRTLASLEAAAREPGVVVHRTPNGGPSLARNFSIERARGAYVLPLDADDYLAPAFLARTVPLLDADPALGVVYTWVGLVGGHHGVWRTGGFSVRDLLSRCTIHVTSLYRRKLWEDVGGYDPRFIESCEDWDFWLGAAKRGWTGRCVPEVLVYYRRSPTSRELGSRAPGVSTRLMRSLVGKHRDLYVANLEDAMAGMYERLAAAGLTLERIYDHPAMRVYVRLRNLLGRRPAA